MSIFNLQALEEKASIKKEVLADNKNKVVHKEDTNRISEEYIFTTTIREVNEIVNTTNANIAYDESLFDDQTNSETLRNIFDSFCKTFTSIDDSLKMKCIELKASIDILKERLDSIEDDSNKKIIVDTDCQYTNLGYIKNSTRCKTLITRELSVDRPEEISRDAFCGNIKDFRHITRNLILNIEDTLPENDETEEFNAKQMYILRLYQMFRKQNIGKIVIDKNFLLDNVAEVYRLLILFSHDIKDIYIYLKEYANDGMGVKSNIVAKHIQVILEEFALLFSARADAIVEYTNKIREYMSLYVEAFGGGDDE